MKKNICLAVAVAFCAFLPFTARAMDGFSVEAGTGKGVDLWRAGAQWKWRQKWFTGGAWHVGGYWDLQLGQWNGHSNITDVGLTPTFRLERPSGHGPYLEAAIGLHYLSHKEITAGKRFSTRFQFGDHVGAGYRFGERGRYDLGLRLQHVSNGSIKRPNPGINFALVRFQYHFE